MLWLVSSGGPSPPERVGDALTPDNALVAIRSTDPFGVGYGGEDPEGCRWR